MSEEESFLNHQPQWITKIGIGQDSHRFLDNEVKYTKPCVIAGVTFKDIPGFQANSDGDVVYHAICNAFSSLTHSIILGDKADQMCLEQKITDSKFYLSESLKSLKKNQKIIHLSITIEGKKPIFLPHLKQMRSNISHLLNISIDSVGITATSGERLNECGQGKGVQCFCILTIMEYLAS